MPNEFKDKTFLVIGASSGIGQCVALELGSLGANVVLLARDQQRLNSTLEQMPQGRHTVISFDATAVAEIDNVVKSMKDSHGRIDGCVYCVGLGGSYRLRDMTSDFFQLSMVANCYAFIEFVRCLVKKKPREQSMRIVGISSLASITNVKYMTAYSASKAAMDAAVRCLATELIPRNITINTIRPGFVDTRMIADLAMNDIVGGINETIKENGYQPQGVIAPDDVAKLAVYLLSDAAKFITGTAMSINGGAPT